MRLRNCVMFLDWSGPLHHGVPQKHIAQVSEWRSSGIDVDFVVVAPSKFVESWQPINCRIFNYRYRSFRVVARTQASIYIWRKNPQFIYRRYAICTIPELILIKLIPTFIELNTNNEFYYQAKSRILGILNKINKIYIFKFMAGAFAVTGEIGRMYEAQTRKIINIATNPINKTTEINPFLNSPNKSTKVVFLGSAKFDWNGLHLLESLKKAVPELEITIIGLGYEPTDFEQIKEVNPSNLIEFLQSFDFGISTLALNEVGLTEAAPLKVRSYLSAGLPIIARFPDSGIPPGSNYYFELRFNEKSEITNVSELKNFLVSNKGRRVTPQEYPQLLIENVETKRLKQILLELNPR